MFKTVLECLKVVGIFAGMIVSVGYLGLMFWTGFVEGPKYDRQVRVECAARGGRVVEHLAAGKAGTEFGLTHPSCEAN